ncbi:MAG: glycogen/starch/alpha-glucan family phosphorylase [Oscillospiraceae bacterium]|nr:glycogen/starch/alpha-glucan family phosphorylase [Oscillospiraceae bacterium]
MKSDMKALIEQNIIRHMGVTPDQASNEQFYKVIALTVNEILKEKRNYFHTSALAKGKAQISYLSMEFLMGRSLKNNLFNLGINDEIAKALESWDVSLDEIYDYEPDAGLGNGGLGRLASCYLDALATNEFSVYGYSILYEFGIFKQKIVDGWQTELADNWLSGGGVWLNPRPEFSIEVNFGGEIEEFWDGHYHHINHKNYSAVTAVPYDMYVPGYSSGGVSVLRLWKAEATNFDMEIFRSGDYAAASAQNMTAQAISKVLYPNDNHAQGKLLRLKQQYFLCAASIGDMVKRHMAQYGSLSNFAAKNAIHINDTHPTLAIPELMRLLLDECGYTWNDALETTKNTFAYTNHTIMREALECWNKDMFKDLLPRIYQIVNEISNQFEQECRLNTPWESYNQMAIIKDHVINMANLCVYICHSVNGVSRLHSDLIKSDLFGEYNKRYPEKFRNVTNGIAYRRWLMQSNPALTNLLCETIGDGFMKNAEELDKFAKYKKDKNVLAKLRDVKRENKERLAKFVHGKYGVSLNLDSIFDVQIKRLHEYKRQHLNALNIISEYIYLLGNPGADFVPKTYIFAAKAAPSYYLAKKIISLLFALSAEIASNPAISEKLKILFIEEYNVTMSELIIPASDISEQISQASTEASGTGNMKLMLNGAVTLGTLDGANVEIMQAVGEDNIIIFGRTADEVRALNQTGYDPQYHYENNQSIRRAIQLLETGINGYKFEEIADSLKYSDPYMVLEDFDSYREAQAKTSGIYRDADRFSSMSLVNIAKAGIFAADRSVKEYAKNIWQIEG